MASNFTRRQFATAAGAASLTTLLPRGVWGYASAAKKAVIHADQEIGTVRPEFHSNFAEHLGSCVYGGMWVGKNSPIPNINGFRKATVDYLKELGVPVLRWPGGCFADDYHWRDGIGPAEKRPKRVNIHWGNYTEDNSFGTHEFIEFCRLIGSEPYFAANVGSGSPREMRDWMEYCNYPKGSTLSDERAANGSPEPFKIRYWGIGNELWGCGGNMQPQQAAMEFRQYATYARNFGTPLYLVGCGPNGNDARWTRGFMETLGTMRMQGYSMHYYENGIQPPQQFTPEGMYTQFNMFPLVEVGLIQQRALLDTYDPNRQIGLILDEWGVWDRIPQSDEQRNGRLWQQATIRSAVAAGLGLNIFNRQADKLYMCNIAQMVNVLQSLILTDGPEGKNCVRTSNYWAFMLFKPHRGKNAVKVEYDGYHLPAVPQGGRGGGRGMPQAPPPPPDLSMSASRQGSEMVLSFVNPRHDTDMDVECTLRGATAKQGRAQILYDSDINAFNSFDNPNRIVIKSHQVAPEGDRVKITLPALSVATVTLQVG
jgi:alpha-N-arabinofuranosidase